MGTTIIDNGAHSIKVTSSSHTRSDEIFTYFNAISTSKKAKTKYIGNEIDACINRSELYYRLPFQQGYLTDWALERQIWNRLFDEKLSNVKPTESDLILTEPWFNPAPIRESYDQLVFEEYGFSSCFRTSASFLAVYNFVKEQQEKGLEHSYVSPCYLVVDSGYSFTHAVPFFDYNPINYAIRRLDIGGKLLTNVLKETISFRYWNVMEETYLVNQIKEQCCFVSQNFLNDLKALKQNPGSSRFRVNYVLPDYSTGRQGFIKNNDLETKPDSGEQILTLTNERFSIPEILFHPSDVGIHQSGLPELIKTSIEACPQELQPSLWQNILLIGGNMRFQGVQERLKVFTHVPVISTWYPSHSELRQLAPDLYNVQVHLPVNPVTYACQGAQRLTEHPSLLRHLMISKADYEEYGTRRNAWNFMTS